MVLPLVAAAARPVAGMAAKAVFKGAMSQGGAEAVKHVVNQNKDSGIDNAKADAGGAGAGGVDPSIGA